VTEVDFIATKVHYSRRFVGKKTHTKNTKINDMQRGIG
jgi:hypothetical protein